MSEDRAVTGDPQIDDTSRSATSGDGNTDRVAGGVSENASHPHVWDRITDICVVDGCGRQKPAWLTSSDTEAVSAATGPSPTGRWASLPRPVRWLVIAGAIAVVVAVGGQKAGSMMGATTGPATGTSIPSTGGGHTAYLPGVIVDSPQPGEAVTITGP